MSARDEDPILVSMRCAESRIRVRYAETDQMGVVYYANYLVWMEIGRVDLCRALGFSYRDLEQNAGVALAVTEAHCRYRSSARYDDDVLIETRLVEVRSRGLRFAYVMRRAQDRQLLAEGETAHVFVTRDGAMTRIPEQYRPYFESGTEQ